MPESTTLDTHYDNADISLIAANVTMNKEFDYFESTSAAREHAKLEGTDYELLEETSLGYTKVSRQYPEDFENNLRTAVNLLDAVTPQDFLHIDRQAITMGRSLTGSDYDRGLDLVMPSHGRSCSLRLRSCDFLRVALIPNPSRDYKVEEFRSAPLEMTLGRNILLDGSDVKDEDRAARDSTREWESVLAVGTRAVEGFVSAHFYKIPGADKDRLMQHNAILGSMRGTQARLRSRGN